MSHLDFDYTYKLFLAEKVANQMLTKAVRKVGLVLGFVCLLFLVIICFKFSFQTISTEKLIVEFIILILSLFLPAAIVYVKVQNQFNKEKQLQILYDGNDIIVDGIIFNKKNVNSCWIQKKGVLLIKNKSLTRGSKHNNRKLFIPKYFENYDRLKNDLIQTGWNK